MKNRIIISIFFVTLYGALLYGYVKKETSNLRNIKHETLNISKPATTTKIQVFQSVIATSTIRENCESFSSSTQKNNCLDQFQTEQLGITENPLVCFEMNSYDQLNKCLYSFSKTVRDRKFCERIPMKSYRELCTEDFDIAGEGNEYCNKFNDEPHEKQECVDRKLAIDLGRQGEIESCDQVKTLEYGFLCQINAIKTSGKGCEGIKDIRVRTECIDRVNYSKAQSIEDCDVLQTEAYKKTCYAFFYNAQNPNYKFDDDNDGLNNIKELWINTDPFKADSDGDGLSDSVEYEITHTDPINADSDGDNINDGEEIKNGSDPERPGVNLEKAVEDFSKRQYGDQAWWENYKQGTSTEKTWEKDSDSDGLIDILEIFYLSNPFLSDTDSDGKLDKKEIEDNTNPTGNGDADFDEDGLNNVKESQNNCNPFIRDTNEDNLNDFETIKAGQKCDSEDTDSDGLSNTYEISLTTNPLNADTDGDGHSDGGELHANYNPCGEGALPTTELLKKACAVFNK